MGVDWIIFYSHRPFYCTDMREEVKDCKTNMFYFNKVEAMLQKYNVDLVLNGHLHLYSRSQNMRNFKFRKDGIPSDTTYPKHIISGRPGTHHALTNATTA